MLVLTSQLVNSFLEFGDLLTVNTPPERGFFNKYPSPLNSPIMAEPSEEFKKRILEEVKNLTNKGRHQEALELYKTYFPDLKK